MTETRICPKCGSTNTKIVASTSYMERCMDCHYSAVNFPIIKARSSGLFKNLHKTQKRRELWKELLTAKWHAYDWVLVFIFLMVITIGATIFIK